MLQSASATLNSTTSVLAIPIKINTPFAANLQADFRLFLRLVTRISIDIGALGLSYTSGVRYRFRLKDDFVRETSNNQTRLPAVDIFNVQRPDEGAAALTATATQATNSNIFRGVTVNLVNPVVFEIFIRYNPGNFASLFVDDFALAVDPISTFSGQAALPVIATATIPGIPNGRLRLNQSTISSAFTLPDLADGWRTKLFDSDISTESSTSTDGDRIRFGVSIVNSSTNISITTLESRRRNTTSLMNTVSSMTASLSIPITLSLTIQNPSTDPDANAFGDSLSIDGNNIIVGSPNVDQNGIAYIFNATTGALDRTINNPNASNVAGQTDDKFGQAVDISGNYAVIGAPQEDGPNSTLKGQAYLFDITTGSLLRTETNLNNSADYYFGLSVAIDGNKWVAGADRDGIRVYSIGAGTEYNFASPNTSDRRQIVDISGDTVIVGIQRSVSEPSATFKVYQYSLTSGFIRTIDNPNPFGTEQGDYFGWDVAVYGNYAVIGAPGEDISGTGNVGKAYVFDLTNGNLLHTFNNPSPDVLDQFGKSVAMNDRYAIISDFNQIHIFDYVAGYLEKSIEITGAGAVSITDNKFIVLTTSVGPDLVAVYSL